MSTKKRIPSALRHTVWSTYFGNILDPKCFCCNKETLSHANYECGHVVSENMNGETKLYNLRPICSSCNKSMGIKNMEDFITNCGFDKHQGWLLWPYNNENTNTEVKRPKKRKKIVRRKQGEPDMLGATNDHLRAICLIYELPTSGSKEQMIRRLKVKGLRYYKEFVKTYLEKHCQSEDLCDLSEKLGLESKNIDDIINEMKQKSLYLTTSLYEIESIKT